MLSAKNAMATIAVKDIAVAKKFYGGTLGFKTLSSEGEEAVIYQSGNSSIVVYQSQYARTNKATSVTRGVGEEREAIVQTLKSAGVPFERYDLPGLRREILRVFFW
jgi:hypothetical protein